MSVINGCSRPTLAVRFWRALGFVYRWDEDLFNWKHAEPAPDEQGWWVPGCVTTHVAVSVSWLDRLRLLVTGCCEVSIYTRTDVLVRRAETRSEFAVLPPGCKPKR